MVKNSFLNMMGVNNSNDELHNGNNGSEGSNNSGGGDATEGMTDLPKYRSRK